MRRQLVVIFGRCLDGWHVRVHLDEACIELTRTFADAEEATAHAIALYPSAAIQLADASSSDIDGHRVQEPATCPFAVNATLRWNVPCSGVGTTSAKLIQGDDDDNA